MIKALRKYHFLLWHVWAFLLPLLFITAIVVRPPSPENATAAKDTFVAELKSLTDSTALVQITVIKPLTVPSCIVFNSVGNKDILLGKLDRQGPYEFVIPRSGQNVILRLYDAIHKQTIVSFTLTLSSDSI
jgi:hypothetical protein